MKCSKIRRLIADGGPAALAGNQKAEDHLIECGECYAVLEAMAEVDRLLPELESHDVADEVVEQLLAHPELKAQPAVAGRFTRVRALRRLGDVISRARRTRLRWGLVAVPAVLVIGLISMTTMRSADDSDPLQATYAVKQFIAKPAIVETEEHIDRKSSDNRERVSSQRAGEVGELSADEAGGGGEPGQPKNRAIDSTRHPAPRSTRGTIPDASRGGRNSAGEAEITVDDRVAADDVPDENLVLVVREGQPSPVPDSELDIVTGQDRRDVGTDSESGALARETESTAGVPVGYDKDELLSSNRRLENKEHQQSLKRQTTREIVEFRDKVAELEAQSAALRDLGDIENAEVLEEQARDLKKVLEGVEIVGGKTDSSSISAPSLQQPQEVDEEALAAARSFLAARAQIDGLSFREARGYWANTYVPGDRTLRRLKARLDRAAGTGAAATFHDRSRQISQPFDAPDRAALAVYLHSDRGGVGTRERMLVQVGLKGTARRAGMRPAMNLGLVLDLRGPVSPDVATSIRALLKALADSAEVGDRFSLTVAGRPGGTILPPGDFRHGPLTVAMGELLSDEASGTVLSLEQAEAEALATVRAADDPNAPLGSSALIVVTAQRLGALTGRLAATAHQSAIDGVPWSVVGIGEGVDLAELDELVLAGQGNRRLLSSAADAEALVDRELAAVSRVVARAVRLRIRLAPGVQLVNVIGSERLGERRSQQVRDAELSIDQRLSRNLAIQADRGLDEEGIQIVIPSFYADDAHVVLLDVVVPGPGPVADVTVRYKDLVHMKNGVARAHLRVGRGEQANGPLERNVLANLLATEVSSRLERAADAVAGCDFAAARAILIDTLNLMRGITILVEGLAQNPDLEADIEMLEGFIQALGTLSANDAAEIQITADSLRYAGRLKILPPPVGDDEPER
jgi:hypothetical protein